MSNIPAAFALASLTRREFLATTLACAAVATPGCRSSHAKNAPSGTNPGDVDSDLRVREAYRYLEVEMDRWSYGTVVYDDGDSGGAGFFPAGWMGDMGDIVLDEASTDSPAAGTTCLKITYTPRGPQRWAGIYWTYPDRPTGNWGKVPGRDLTGATRLRGWIRGTRGGEIVELKIGGINRPPRDDPSRPHQDSFGPVGTRVALTREWQRFDLPIPRGVSLKSVIGALAWTVSAAYNPERCVIYLDEVAYDNADPDGLRLVRSYMPTADSKDRAIRNAAFLYDNALVLLAFVSRGDAEGRRRARIMADSIVWAQSHDRTYRDGRWRNAYSCGPLKDPATGTARLPGWYDRHEKRWLEDRYAASSDSGNTAWAMIALLSAHSVLASGRKDSPYLRAVLRAGQWIEEHCRAGGSLGGYAGGFEGWEETTAHPVAPKRLEWRSTEHNLDLYAAFSQLAMATGHAAWQKRAVHARTFVLNMWNAKGRFFWTGVRDSQGTLNLDAVPADVQTWTVLAMGHDMVFRQKIGWTGPPEVPDCLKWVEENCRLGHRGTNPECLGVAGYRFSNKGRGVWFEGSAHVAAAYRYLGDQPHAEGILDEIVRANPVGQPAAHGVAGAGVPMAGGGIYAACPDPAETGFLKEFAPGVIDKWTYPRRLHIGATAWFLLAQRGVNPYWLNGPPATLK